MIGISHVRRKSPEEQICKKKIIDGHYLHTMPHQMTSYEIYKISVFGEMAGYLVFGRPQSTFFRGWYGDLEQVKSGICECTKWQVLNLARVWISPDFQTGGINCFPGMTPGFHDRKRVWRSTLASEAIRMALPHVRINYLVNRPPVFLDEPYELRWLLSYCNQNLHRGVIYREAGFEYFSVNKDNVATYRIQLPPLSTHMHILVNGASNINARANRLRSKRNQLTLNIEGDIDG